MPASYNRRMGFWGHNLLVAGSDGSRTASQLLEAIERLSVDGDVWMSSGALGRIGGAELVACSLERRGADDQVIAALSRAVGGAALISIRIGASDVCDARLLRDGSVEAVAVIGHETWDYTWQAGPKPDSSLVNAEAWVDVLGYSVEELVEIVEGSYGFVEDGVSRLLGRLVDHPEVGSMSPAEYVGDAIYGIDERLPVPAWLHDVVGFAGSTPARAQGRPRLVFAPIVSGPPYVGALTRTLALHVGVFNNGGAGRGLRTLVGGHAVESGFVSPISANLGPLGFGPELDESDHPLQTDRGVQFDWPDKELEAAIVDERPGAQNWNGWFTVSVLCETTGEGAAELWLELWSPDSDEPPLGVEAWVVVDERFAQLPDDVEGWQHRRQLLDEVTRPYRRPVSESFHGPFRWSD